MTAMWSKKSPECVTGRPRASSLMALPVLSRTPACCRLTPNVPAHLVVSGRLHSTPATVRAIVSCSPNGDLAASASSPPSSEVPLVASGVPGLGEAPEAASSARDQRRMTPGPSAAAMPTPGLLLIARDSCWSCAASGELAAPSAPPCTTGLCTWLPTVRVFCSEMVRPVRCLSVPTHGSEWCRRKSVSSWPSSSLQLSFWLRPNRLLWL
mmetsp:Transcript_2082/g.8276  ORF Transcript_2082/g.8276 Transcript_2082/m.8276 type:complete len:210 (-) Transcript_2082:874-1503(-)